MEVKTNKLYKVLLEVNFTFLTTVPHITVPHNIFLLFNFRLFYKKNSDPKHKTCLYNCSKIQEETGDDGEIYQFCEFFEGSLYDQYELFLADSSRCSEVEKDCWNCDGEIGEKEEFNCSPENGKIYVHYAVRCSQHKAEPFSFT